MASDSIIARPIEQRAADPVRGIGLTRDGVERRVDGPPLAERRADRADRHRQPGDHHADDREDQRCAHRSGFLSGRLWARTAALK